MQQVSYLFPKSVLDIGCGFGKYGVLCREMLDIEQGRLHPTDWQTKIVGVEGFKSYENVLHKSIYTAVWYEDFTLDWSNYFGWDLVLMIDSLEHIPKELGHAMLEYLIENNKHVIVSCPDGDYPQGATNGNELERHRAVWLKRDFELRGARILHSGVCTVAYFRGKGI